MALLSPPLLRSQGWFKFDLEHFEKYFRNQFLVGNELAAAAAFLLAIILFVVFVACCFCKRAKMFDNYCNKRGRSVERCADDDDEPYMIVSQLVDRNSNYATYWHRDYKQSNMLQFLIEFHEIKFYKIVSPFCGGYWTVEFWLMKCIFRIKHIAALAGCVPIKCGPVQKRLQACQRLKKYSKPK